MSVPERKYAREDSVYSPKAVFATAALFVAGSIGLWKVVRHWRSAD